MEIKALDQTPLVDIVNCLTDAFSNYFVKMPDSVDYWNTRFNAVRVNYNLSFGAFDNGKLVAFIINGIDTHNGKLTAFNTGTGVISSHRGNQLVDQLYSFAIPPLKAAGVQKCMLEVIEGNEVAIKVYKRIGFKITRSLKCFKGEIKPTTPPLSVRPINFETAIVKSKQQHLYSWDHTQKSVAGSSENFLTYGVFDNNQSLAGYFCINPSRGYLPQIESFSVPVKQIVDSIHAISPTIKINNVDESRTKLIKAFKDAGVDNPIDQFEMEVLIKDLTFNA